MVIDTSALVAILRDEPERDRMARAIDADTVRLVSAATLLETSIVVLGQTGEDGVDDLDLLLTRIQADIRPFRGEDLSAVRRAYTRYGKGRHPAGLNFGDCFAYALSKETGQPLLFKGGTSRRPTWTWLPTEARPSRRVAPHASGGPASAP